MDRELELAISNLKSPQDIMDFLGKFIRYGCISSGGARYEDSLGGNEFRSQYRTLSLEDTLQKKIGACIEQTNVTKYLFTRMNVKSKTLCVRGFNEEHKAYTDVYLVHCFTLAYVGNKVLNVEYSDSEFRNIYVYDSEDIAILKSYEMFGGKFKRHGATQTSLDEYADYVPGGLTFDEFNEFINATGIRILSD